MTKERLDRLLVDRGMVSGRNQAYAAIVAGEVRIDGQVCVKPSRLVDKDEIIQYQSGALEYVSRGGRKLEHALDFFKIAATGLKVLDSGVSTGGFTDCLLRRGAEKVIAVDVGYGQLAWRLRQDSRVELHERTNLRYLTLKEISEPADLAVLDLSFISLTKVMPAVVRCLTGNGTVLALVKPQFEAGKGKVGKRGVVKDKEVHLQVLRALIGEFIRTGLSFLDATWSPVLGAKGNIEFWLYLSKKASLGYAIEEIAGVAAEVVEEAHRVLPADK